jgi:hypothetical protein
VHNSSLTLPNEGSAHNTAFTATRHSDVLTWLAQWHTRCADELDSVAPAADYCHVGICQSVSRLLVQIGELRSSKPRPSHDFLSNQSETLSRIGAETRSRPTNELTNEPAARGRITCFHTRAATMLVTFIVCPCVRYCSFHMCNARTLHSAGCQNNIEIQLESKDF